jgi:two-component system, OmpR family, phosphate regulon sensor histidine kinase PhoR
MSRRRHMALAIAGMLAMLTVLIGGWIVAYAVTSRIYDHLNRRPDDLIVQLINSLLGAFLFCCLASVVSVLAQVRQKQADLFQSMNEAIQRIAKGDFSVHLKLKQARDHPFGELTESINHMVGELSRMERMRQEFISDVSHEIQSPLTSINGFAKALQCDSLDADERTHYLGIIETESMRLSRLSENLLKLTALESDHPPFEPKRYRLDKQLRNIVLSLEPQWIEKTLDMDVSLEEVSIDADEDLMSQVWVNLLHNSIKFTPNGGTISVHLRRCGQEAVVCIADTGTGIAQDDQARIFERFYKADTSRTRATGGSGLGLAIARKITEMHKGTIRVESAMGAGTILTVRVPEIQGAKKQSDDGQAMPRSPGRRATTGS